MLPADRRARRTEQSIYNSFMNLLTYKSFKKITIKEIANNANIERKTFYLHYDSLDELLTLIETQFQTDLSAELEHLDQLNAQSLIGCLNKLMEQDKRFYKKILNTSPNTFIVDDLQLILERELEKYFQAKVNSNNDVRNHLYAVFITGGIIQTYRHYLRNEYDLSALSNMIAEVIDKVWADCKI